MATATAAWVDAVAGTGARIRDTRKTLPGLRLLEKYAVRCGGGVNHRLGLGDAVLIKDNHVAAAGSVGAALAAARARPRSCPARWRWTRSTSWTRCWRWAPSWCCWTTSRWPPRRRRCAAAAGAATRLESSGGLVLANARAYAETGVDYLAVGALTHSVTALDLGLDLQLA